MTQVEIQEMPIDAPQEPVREEPAPQEPVQEEPAPQELAQEAPAPQEPTPPKRKRGRPPGSKNVQKEPKAPPKAPPKAKGKAKSAAPPPSDEESLPEYVQQSLPPRPQDFATQLFTLLQDHERERVGRRRATYASWLSRF